MRNLRARFTANWRLLLPTSGHWAAWTIYCAGRENLADTHTQAIARVRRMGSPGSPVVQAARDNGFVCAMSIAYADNQRAR